MKKGSRGSLWVSGETGRSVAVAATETTATATVATAAAAFTTTTTTTTTTVTAGTAAAAFATTAATISAAAAFTATTTAVGATETAATTAFATATTVAATTTTAKTARAGRAWLHGASFVHHQAAATQGCAVHAFNGCQSFGIAAHLDKTKTFRAARVTLHHDFRAGHRTELSKRLLEIAVAH